MADKIFGTGLAPLHLTLVEAPTEVSAVAGDYLRTVAPREVVIDGLATAPAKGKAVADATDEADAVLKLNKLLASLRAAGVIAS